MGQLFIAIAGLVVGYLNTGLPIHQTASSSAFSSRNIFHCYLPREKTDSR